MTLLTLLTSAVLLINGSSLPFQKKSHPDGDQRVLDQLKKAGSHLDKPHTIEFFVYLPTEDKAKKAAELVKKEGCKFHVELGGYKKNCLRFATTTIVPNPSAPHP